MHACRRRYDRFSKPQPPSTKFPCETAMPDSRCLTMHSTAIPLHSYCKANYSRICFLHPFGPLIAA